ncbi:MAG: DUF1573 domain-containing protein [Cyclobacteriaceae bacterium]|nr:DUF1573 domain-containing protein [Cyclobacteriaceae bacterium]
MLNKQKTFLLIVLFISYSTVFAQFQSPDFKWTKTTHEFGKIKHKSPVSIEFEFTNKGQAPLVISEVEGSCGCTVAEYTRDPILPGKKGKVRTTFDAAALGKFHKTIKVVANVEGGPEYLYVQGTVVP